MPPHCFTLLPGPSPCTRQTLLPRSPLSLPPGTSLGSGVKVCMRSLNPCSGLGRWLVGRLLLHAQYAPAGASRQALGQLSTACVAPLPACEAHFQHFSLI